ncbi:cobalamin biosynthesis protein [Novosphingobium sp. 9]|uniref:cobalamin biosynthesis protein n=1 Tax=Novosphingobium sp. 9 TaxID=2025349 RepID=UPI0021B58CF8|nr:cobalamin biosynthesis protein [Novosphingobium sp. 9]
MIVAGFGFRAGAGVASLQAALALAAEGTPAVTHLATLEDKADALAPLAEWLGLPVIAVSPEACATVSTLTRSMASMAARGLGSVAEASALAAAGSGARLAAPRALSPDGMATCAIASTIDASSQGSFAA